MDLTDCSSMLYSLLTDKKRKKHIQEKKTESTMDQAKKDDVAPSTSKGRQKMNAVEIEKPLLRLLKHLVNFLDCEERTVLTNSQLMYILYKEFHINTAQSHALEVDIYMNILKRFLKEWPRWDVVDSLVQKSKVDKSIEIESYLNDEYICLKKYLKEMLDLSKDAVDAAVKRVQVPEGRIEISCSRSQLNQLFYKQVHPTENTIFHIESSNNGPSKISLNSFSPSHILNWPFVNVYINTTLFEYERKNSAQFKHTLVNKKLGVNPPIPSISRSTLVKNRNKLKKSEVINKDIILAYIDYLLQSDKLLSHEYVGFYKCLLNLIKDDIGQAPDPIDKNMDYMYFLSEYPYVRYLNGPDISVTKHQSKDMNMNLNLSLQEFIMPCVTFNVARLAGYSKNMTILSNSFFKFDSDTVDSFLRELGINLECKMCDVKCSGPRGFWEFSQHFMEVHRDEEDWKCANCHKKFSMPEITVKKWMHSPCVG